MPKVSVKDLQQRRTTYIKESIPSFNGGMNLLLAETDINTNEYREAFNVSNRYGNLEPFNQNQEIASSIVGKKQALVAFGQYIIIFSGGLCYYQNTLTGLINRVDNFQMSDSVDRLYVIAIPPSSSNFKRTSSTDGTGSYDTTFRVNGSPAGLLVQDGINQPWLIYVSDGNVEARRTKTYDEWTVEDREYVPVGLDMLLVDGILWIVSPDKKRLYRSVTNRPLDFVVSVDASGYKSPNAIDGDARISSFFVSYSDIIALAPYTSTSFIASTNAPHSYVINISRERLVWGEPTFSKDDLFNSALINSHSLVDNLGDKCFISYKGIRSFNSTRQLYIESKNEIFSGKINAALEGVLQDSNSAAISFEDYLFFSINTIWGYAIGVYDLITSSWCSFILTPNSKVKQFATLLPHYNKLYAITTDNKILEIFGSTTPMTGFVKTIRFAVDDLSVQHKLVSLRPLLENQLQDGTILVTAFVDNKVAESKSQILQAGVSNSVFSAEFPVVEDRQGVENKALHFTTNPLQGYKIGYNIQWSGGGMLSGIQHTSEVTTPILDQKQQIQRGI